MYTIFYARLAQMADISIMIRGAYPLLCMAMDDTPELVMFRVKISDPVSAFHTLWERERERDYKKFRIMSNVGGE